MGECALFRGLSFEDTPEYENKLEWLTSNTHLSSDEISKELERFPSIVIGYEQALLNLEHGKDLYFPSAFTLGHDSIRINGLIWMGDKAFMEKQIKDKLDKGFGTIKLKIGTNWLEEKKILTSLRKSYPSSELVLRVDANGAFSYEKAKEVLNELHSLEIHSIEQPIKAGQRALLSNLVKESATPIALDEELIGVTTTKDKEELLDTVNPPYLILKPSLLGGFKATDEWIALAEKRGIGWWITSALESNLGLNALAQYTYTKKPELPQGLGTGALFSNNLESSLSLTGELLTKKT